MDFKELLSRYENGEATPGEAVRVEEELEKYRLLTDYVVEHDDPLPPGPAAGAADGTVKRLRRAARRERLLLLFGAAVMACLLLFVGGTVYQKAVLPLVNRFVFLDPNAAGEFASETRTLDVALGVFDEMLHPGCTTIYSGAEITGLWKYDLSVYRSVNGERADFLMGTLDKDKFELGEGFQMLGPPLNAFTRGNAPFREPWDGMVPARVAEELGKLPAYVNARAQLSFDRDLSMGELAELMERYPGVAFYWVGVRNSAADRGLIPLVGFDPRGLSFADDAVEEKYPYLMYFRREEDQTAYLTEHFKALMKFTADHGRLMDAIGGLEGGVDSFLHFGPFAEEVLDYVEENGVMTYGVYVSGRPADLAELCGLDYVEQVGLEGLKLSVDTRG